MGTKPRKESCDDGKDMFKERAKRSEAFSIFMLYFRPSFYLEQLSRFSFPSFPIFYCEAMILNLLLLFRRSRQRTGAVESNLNIKKIEEAFEKK